MRFIYVKILVIILFSLTSCQNMVGFSKLPALDSLKNSHKMNIREFFDGDISGFAITRNSSGKIMGSKNIKISASWDQNKGHLKQEFLDPRGDRQTRTWLVTLHKDGTFDAIGHDAIAPALGRQVGNAAQMIYTLMLNKSGMKKKYKFDDRIYLVDPKSAIMISYESSGFGSQKMETIISLTKEDVHYKRSHRKRLGHHFPKKHHNQVQKIKEEKIN